MKPPSPAHAITIEKNPNRVKVTFNGTVIADTTRALVLHEGALPAVQYSPSVVTIGSWPRASTRSV